MADKKRAAFDEILKEDYTEEEREKIVKEWAKMWPDAAIYYEEMKRRSRESDITATLQEEVDRFESDGGSIAPEFVINGTVTGRMSSMGPNFSALPMGMPREFVRHRSPDVMGRMSCWKPNIMSFSRDGNTGSRPCSEIALGPPQPCVLPMPEPQEKVVPKLRIFIADHFSLDMIKDAGALEQGRISRGEARLFAHLAEFEVCSLIRDERVANVLTDLLQVQLVVDKREDKHFIGIGEIVIFVEETLAGFQFWRLDVLKETRAMGSGKKAWSW